MIKIYPKKVSRKPANKYKPCTQADIVLYKETITTCVIFDFFPRKVALDVAIFGSTQTFATTASRCILQLHKARFFFSVDVESMYYSNQGLSMLA